MPTLPSCKVPEIELMSFIYFIVSSYLKYIILQSCRSQFCDNVMKFFAFSLFILASFSHLSDGEISPENQEIIRKWLPLFWLHSEEVFNPINFDYYIRYWYFYRFSCNSWGNVSMTIFLQSKWDRAKYFITSTTDLLSSQTEGMLIAYLTIKFILQDDS